MEDFNSQVAEFVSPFPAKIFEQAMEDAEIDYQSHTKSSGDGGFDSVIFFVNTKDFNKAFILKEKVDKENAASELEHIHPLRRKLAYIFLCLIVIYLAYKLFENL